MIVIVAVAIIVVTHFGEIVTATTTNFVQSFVLSPSAVAVAAAAAVAVAAAGQPNKQHSMNYSKDDF